MPEVLKKDNGDIDWSKIFMGFAMALVFVMQQYHAMQVSNLKSNIVPRAEYEAKHRDVMDKDVIISALKELNNRLDRMEEK